MPSWNSYSPKTTPDDADTLMIKDNVSTGNPNRQLSLSNFWAWIMSKTYAFTGGTTSIPTAINALQTAADTIGDLDDLETTDKSSVVDAINETLGSAGVHVTVNNTTLEIT